MPGAARDRERMRRARAQRPPIRSTASPCYLSGHHNLTDHDESDHDPTPGVAPDVPSCRPRGRRRLRMFIAGTGSNAVSPVMPQAPMEVRASELHSETELLWSAIYSARKNEFHLLLIQQSCAVIDRMMCISSDSSGGNS